MLKGDFVKSLLFLFVYVVNYYYICRNKNKKYGRAKNTYKCFGVFV